MSVNTDPPAEGEGKSPDEKLPMQRRVFGAQRRASPAPADARPELEEKLANLADSVKVLQNHLIGGPVASAPMAEPEARPRKLKRFHRMADDEAVEAEVEPVLDHEVRGTEATLNKNIAWPRLARVAAGPAYARTHPAGSERKRSVVIWALAQLAGLALLLIGFWAGQSLSGDEEAHPDSPDSAAAMKSPAVDPLTRIGVNDRALEAVDRGLQAEKAGDLNAARQTWESAADGRGRLPGADYRLAMVAIRNNDISGADIHLADSLAAGEMMASAYFVNACFAGKKGDYLKAAQQLAHAVRVEPFSAKYMFCWGEALRRAGKAQAAADAIAHALDRPASPSDLELFTFKLRLAKIEAGQDATFDAELTAHLSKTPVAGDWLLLAAARDLSHAAYPSAAGHLREAARVLMPERFHLFVQDFAFQSYANRPDVTVLLNVPPPPSSVGPLDPGAWPTDEADPATWPPFSPAL